MRIAPYPPKAPVIGFVLLMGRKAPLGTFFDSIEAAQAFAGEWNIGDEGTLFAVMSAGSSAAALGRFEAHMDRNRDMGLSPIDGLPPLPGEEGEEWKQA